jgi:hypothetical protein
VRQMGVSEHCMVFVRSRAVDYMRIEIGNSKLKLGEVSVSVCMLNVGRPERLKEGVATSRPDRAAAASSSKNQGQPRCMVPL